MNKKYARYLLRKTTQDYNLIAEHFSRTREKIWEEMRFLLDDYLIPGEKVLDLGCGNGRFYPAMKDKKVDYFGVDSSEKLIEIAKKRYPEAKFQVADALSLPFPRNFFDKVYSIAVLHQIPSEELRLQFLREAKRVLKPERFLILTCWKFHQPKELFLIFKLLGLSKLDFGDIFEPWGKKIKRYYHCFSKKELINLVKKADFKIKNVDLVKNERGNRQNYFMVLTK
jgi:ubiquinone/menaquinone biosynthesis C-methylase UbiE